MSFNWVHRCGKYSTVWGHQSSVKDFHCSRVTQCVIKSDGLILNGEDLFLIDFGDV